MPQTFYITQDEEILSVVGRLRSSELLENVFVIPKRALILQSIVNLRMLAREAEKSGKQAIVVTQDENGRRLAEKAGLMTHPYSDDAARVPEPVIREVPADELPTHHPGVFSDSVGSSEYFRSDRSMTPDVVSGRPVSEMKIRIRNASPVRQTALNSKRSESDPVAAGKQSPRQAAPFSAPRASLSHGGLFRDNDEPGRLTRVFSSSGRESKTESDQGHVRKHSGHQTSVEIRGKTWFSAFVTLSVIFLVGTGAFLFLPKAVISVTPMSIIQDVGMEFEGKTDASAVGERMVPVRIVEKEETVSVTRDASGSTSGNGSKATGKILIYNEFGTESQPLVATTRFQSGDGKIFRLSKGITVPGISDRNGRREPGVVEAEVIADEAGDGYNIGATDFSIPGFSGSAKAGKIYAKSTSSMIGGSSSGQSGVLSISASDIEQAKSEATEAFRKAFVDSLGGEIAEGDRFIVEAMDIQEIGVPTVPGVGSVASSFEYRTVFRGKAFVFSEVELRERAVAILRKKASIDDTYSPGDVTFRYEGATSDYQGGTFRFKVGVNAMFVAAVNTDTLREDFLGKKSEEIKAVLERHSEVKNVEIELRPKGMSFAVPKNPKRVTVVLLQP
ncbi:MAG: hypothetical protein HGB34_04370 [Candidatus Moranbacteria bacterium]|nr:hypothetical protein [Candidatus Moranbacteria bacterium]